MRLDHAFVLYAIDPVSGETDIVAAYLDERDALGALRSHQSAGQTVFVERCPLAASSGAGAAATREDGARETEDALDDVLRAATRHNVTACAVVVNGFGGGARMHFPTWSTIQAEGDTVQARLLESDPQRTDASLDMLTRLANGMAQQTQQVVMLARDLHQRRHGQGRLVVVPGLPQGMPPPPRVR